MRLPDKIEGLKKTVPTPESVGVVSSEHIPPEHAPTKETVTASGASNEAAALAAAVALAAKPLDVGGRQ